MRRKIPLYPDETQTSNIDGDKITFSDDTGVAFEKPEDIIHKLQIYDKVAQQNHLLVRWGSIHFSTPKNEIIPRERTESPHPYIKIKCVAEGEMLGHLAESGKNRKRWLGGHP